MEAIQGLIEGFNFPLPLTGMIICTGVTIALLANGKRREGLILFGYFFLYQIYIANKGFLVDTLNSVQAAGDSSGMLMGFAGFAMAALILLACLPLMHGRN